jgi:hypothetical protein
VSGFGVKGGSPSNWINFAGGMDRCSAKHRSELVAHIKKMETVILNSADDRTMDI